VTVRWQPLDAGSVTAWAELTNLLAKVDGTDEYYEAEDLAEELAEPGVDPALDTVGVWSGDLLVGFGQLRVSDGLSDGRVSAGLGGGVHPDFRNHGLGRQIMDRLEQRALELSAHRHPGVPVQLRVSGGLEGASIRAMLAGRGYAIARYFHEMRLPLLDPSRSSTRPPDGSDTTTVQPYRDELSEAVRLAHNDAFATHWGSTPRSPEQWQSFVGSRTFRPASSFVVTAPDDSVSAYALTTQWVEGEIWIDIVGTRPELRGRGLARACLAASLKSALEQGYSTAGLGVDSQNADGAGRLYSSLGFTVDKTFASYVRTEPPLR
jgi:mycothiol synthase